jgi:hypothetical protein
LDKLNKPIAELELPLSSLTLDIIHQLKNGEKAE